MPLARDPDTLRVPAFMRKRSFRSRLAKPLILTALDRKKAGMAGKVKRQKSKVAPPPKRLWRAGGKNARPAVAKHKKMESFSAPFLNFYAESFTEPAAPPKKSKSIGIITNYYEKIRVGVIKLSGTLSVGDCIVYETDESQYEQIVESMEINRQPAFKAGRGKEIGLKLRKKPLIGKSVYVQKPILR